MIKLNILPRMYLKEKFLKFLLGDIEIDIRLRFHGENKHRIISKENNFCGFLICNTKYKSPQQITTT